MWLTLSHTDLKIKWDFYHLVTNDKWHVVCVGTEKTSGLNQQLRISLHTQTPSRCSTLWSNLIVISNNS